MNYPDYQNLFNEILNNPNPAPPYNNELYFNYTKLNRSRSSRWDKHLTLSETLINRLKQITSPQHWIIITEPWCGDAAHIVPFLIRMTEQNPLLSYEIQLRDSEPFLINNYLTNGTKSIPKLIARNANGTDKFVWGARPKEAQELVYEMKQRNESYENIKLALQNWYNQDKGAQLCREIESLL